MTYTRSITATSFATPRTAFTYVHLLVLISIVALLVALFVPTMERLREKENLAMCKDNLRKIGSALILYTHASGGELPVSATVENPHSELLNCLAVGQFVGDPKNYYCPSEHRPDRTFSDQNFKSGVIGYYYYKRGQRERPIRHLASFSVAASPGRET